MVRIPRVATNFGEGEHHCMYCRCLFGSLEASRKGSTLKSKPSLLLMHCPSSTLSPDLLQPSPRQRGETISGAHSFIKEQDNEGVFREEGH